MSTCIDHIPCLKCGSSNTPALAVYTHPDEPDRKDDGYCWSCLTWFPEPYDGREELEGIKGISSSVSSTQQDLRKAQDISHIQANSSVQAIEHRGLNERVCKFYGIRSSVNPTDGETTNTYFPYYKGESLCGYKVVTRDKRIYWVGDAKKSQFFGQQKFSKRKLIIITEGESDCAAATQMLRDQDKSYAVISVPSGASDRAFKDNFEWVSQFESIALSFDNDEPGKNAVGLVTSMFKPGTVKSLSSVADCKDANDCLLKGRSKEFLNSVYSSVVKRPDGIREVKDVMQEALAPIEYGLSYPFPSLTKKTYGIRTGELITIGAGSGSGKSTFLKELVHHLTEEHKQKVGALFLEEPVARTLKNLAGLIANKRFHIPSDVGHWTTEELKAELKKLQGKVYLYDSFGAKDWENIKNRIRYMVSVIGCKFIILDHLTALVAQETNEYTALNTIMEEMSSLTVELNCTIFLVSHLKKAEGKSHNEGGRVTVEHLKGSGAIAFWSHFIFGLERNQQAEDEDERNTTILRVLKDRYTGEAIGLTIPIFYDKKTGRWKESKVVEIEENYDKDSYKSDEI